MSKINKLRSIIDKAKGNKEQLENDIAEYQQSIKNNNRYLKDLEKARGIVQLVGQQTQEQLKFHISDIASLALESIFSEPYKLLLEFLTKRNKTECNILFERGGNKVDPKSASGGGTVDVAAFALRIASWSMRQPRTRNTIIMDEPFRFLSNNHQEDASAIIKEISDKLGIQFIIVTHSNLLASHADRKFTTSINKGITIVKQF